MSCNKLSPMWCHTLDPFRKLNQTHRRKTVPYNSHPLRRAGLAQIMCRLDEVPVRVMRPLNTVLPTIYRLTPKIPFGLLANSRE